MTNKNISPLILTTLISFSAACGSGELPDEGDYTLNSLIDEGCDGNLAAIESQFDVVNIELSVVDEKEVVTATFTDLSQDGETSIKILKETSDGNFYRKDVFGLDLPKEHSKCNYNDPSECCDVWITETFLKVDDGDVSMESSIRNETIYGSCERHNGNSFLEPGNFAELKENSICSSVTYVELEPVATEE